MASNKAHDNVGTAEEIAHDAGTTATQQPLDSKTPIPIEAVSEEKNVHSVALADAIAKDKPNYRSKRQIQLYLFVGFVVLSMLFTTQNHCVLADHIQTVA